MADHRPVYGHCRARWGLGRAVDGGGGAWTGHAWMMDGRPDQTRGTVGYREGERHVHYTMSPSVARGARHGCYFLLRQAAASPFSPAGRRIPWIPCFVFSPAGGATPALGRRLRSAGNIKDQAARVQTDRQGRALDGWMGWMDGGDLHSLPLQARSNCQGRAG